MSHSLSDYLEHNSNTDVKQVNNFSGYPENDTIVKIQYQDFENSSNPFNLNLTLANQTTNTSLRKASSKQNTNRITDDDLEIINSNSKPFIVKSPAPTPSDHHQVKTVYSHDHSSNHQEASSRHLGGGRNDWGNSSPLVNSENEHYWDEQKKTKANINNVNHRMKDFSSIFFVSATRHDTGSLTEDLVQQNINQTSENNDTLQRSIDNTTQLSVGDTVVNATLQDIDNSTNSDQLLNTTRDATNGETLTNASHTEPITNSTSSYSQKEEDSVVVVIDKKTVKVEDELKDEANTSESNIRIKDVDASAVIPYLNGTQQNQTEDFTKHLLNQLQSLGTKRHFQNDTYSDIGGYEGGGNSLVANKTRLNESLSRGQPVLNNGK